MQKIAKLAAGYINAHPIIKDCLAMDMVNYSKLSRKIISELGISSSKEGAVVVACRRYAAALRKVKHEETALELLKKSRKTIKIEKKTASISFAVSEKHLPKIIEFVK